MQPETCKHRRHEPQRFTRCDCQPGDGRSRAIASPSPADTEQCGAQQQARIDITRTGQLEAHREPRLRAAQHPALADRADQQRRAQHPHQGGIEITRNVEEAKHTARKAEIEKIIGTDEYYEKGLDKEYAQILERELRRRK